MLVFLSVKKINYALKKPRDETIDKNYINLSIQHRLLNMKSSLPCRKLQWVSYRGA